MHIACMRSNEDLISELLKRIPLHMVIGTTSNNNKNIFDYVIRIGREELFLRKMIEFLQENPQRLTTGNMSYCQFLDACSNTALKNINRINPDFVVFLFTGFCKEYQVTKYHGNILNKLMTFDIDSALLLLKISIDNGINRLTFCISERNPQLLCRTDDDNNGIIFDHILEKRLGSADLIINIVRWLALQKKIDIELLVFLLKQYRHLTSNFELFQIFSSEATEILRFSLEHHELDIAKHILKIKPYCYIDKQGYLLFDWINCAMDGQLLVSLVTLAPATLRMYDRKGDSAIHAAINVNNSELVEEIITQNPETLGVRDRNSLLPIERVVQLGNLSLCAILLRLTPVAKLELTTVGAILDKAVEHNDLSLVSMILQTAPDALNVLNEDGFSPFHRAVAMDHTDIISIILSLTPDSINLLDDNGFSPIHWAVGKNNPNIVNLILNTSPLALTIKDAQGRTALHRAIYDEKIDIINAMHNFLTADVLTLQDADGNTALHVAVRRDNLEIISQIINNAPIDILNVSNNRGISPLQLAIGTKKSNTARLILAAFPSAVDMVFTNGLTPLHIAISVGLVDLVKVILEKSPHAAEQCDGNGRAPRDYAYRYNNTEIIAMLSSDFYDQVAVSSRSAVL